KFNVQITWKDVMFAVQKVTERAFEMKNTSIVDVNFLESAVRMRLYVFDSPPRKDEYRLLMKHKPSEDDEDDERKCNWYDIDYSNIVLNVFELSSLGKHVIHLTKETSLLLNELKHKSPF